MHSGRDDVVDQDNRTRQPQARNHPRARQVGFGMRFAGKLQVIEHVDQR